MFKCCDGLISGIVSLDMATRNGSQWRLFVQTFEDVVEASLEEVDCDPPEFIGPEAEYRDVVFDSLLPNTPAGKVRKTVLKGLIRSILRSKVIRFYTRGGGPSKRRAHARKLTKALLPSRLGTLRRQRWLTTVRPVKAAALLAACFNLLDRVLFHFYRRSRKMRDLPMAPIVAAAAHLDDDPMSADEADALPAGAAPPVNNEGVPDWSAWNRAQVRSVERFRRSNPSGPLLVVSTCTESIAKLASDFVVLHSEAYDQQQRAAFVAGGDYETIGTALLKGYGVNEYKDSVEQAFWSEDVWKLLPPELRTVRLRGLASACLSRSRCGVQQLILDDINRLPHTLQRLLFDPACAEELLAIPECQWDSYVEMLFSKFPEPEKLRSAPCLRQLFVIAWLHPRSAMVLESRMALIRSITRQRQHTWKKAFKDVNSEWLVLQHRTTEGSTQPTAPRRHGHKRKLKVTRGGKFVGCATGGGGGSARRA